MEPEFFQNPSNHSRPIRRLIPRPKDNMRADTSRLSEEVMEKDEKGGPFSSLTLLLKTTCAGMLVES